MLTDANKTFLHWTLITKNNLPFPGLLSENLKTYVLFRKHFR